MAENEVRGYLVITVIESSGKNKDENYVWDSSSFEGFVKGASRSLSRARLMHASVWRLLAALTRIGMRDQGRDLAVPRSWRLGGRSHANAALTTTHNTHARSRAARRRAQHQGVDQEGARDRHGRALERVADAVSV